MQSSRPFIVDGSTGGLPAGSPEAWQAILKVRRAVNEGEYHERPLTRLYGAALPVAPKPESNDLVTCERCGVLTRQNSNKTKKYCGPCDALDEQERKAVNDAAHNARRAKTFTPKDCKRCGKTFTPELDGGRLFCDGCKAEARLERRRADYHRSQERKGRREVRMCVRCNAEITDAGNALRMHCAPCQIVVQRENAKRNHEKRKLARRAVTA